MKNFILTERHIIPAYDQYMGWVEFEGSYKECKAYADNSWRICVAKTQNDFYAVHRLEYGENFIGSRWEFVADFDQDVEAAERYAKECNTN